MSKLHLHDTTERIDVWGLKPSFGHFMVADLAVFDSDIGSKTAILMNDNGEPKYEIELPSVGHELDMPSAFNLVTFKILKTYAEKNEKL